jgi:hypothetical protein
MSRQQNKLEIPISTSRAMEKKKVGFNAITASAPPSVSKRGAPQYGCDLCLNKIAACLWWVAWRSKLDVVIPTFGLLFYITVAVNCQYLLFSAFPFSIHNVACQVQLQSGTNRCRRTHYPTLTHHRSRQQRTIRLWRGRITGSGGTAKIRFVYCTTFGDDASTSKVHTVFSQQR